MTSEELNTALYKKMFAEQESYENWLLGQSPRDILDHTYEYTIREDILLYLECMDLEDEECVALLALDTPLDAVYQYYDRCENSHMDDISMCISDVARRNQAKK